MTCSIAAFVVHRDIENHAFWRQRRILKLLNASGSAKNNPLNQVESSGTALSTCGLTTRYESAFGLGGLRLESEKDAENNVAAESVVGE